MGSAIRRAAIVPARKHWIGPNAQFGGHPCVSAEQGMLIHDSIKLSAISSVETNMQLVVGRKMPNFHSLADARKKLEEGGVARTVSIAFTPRSGSTQLCRVLRNQCGLPAEYFQYPYEANSLSSYNCFSSSDDVVNFLLSHTANQTFASKLSNDQRAHLDERLEKLFDGYHSLDDLLPNHRWVMLTRRDLVGQALSLYVARKTGRWHLEKADQWRGDPDLHYDYFGIYAGLLYLASSAASLDAYFQSLQLAPLKIYYEDLVERPSQVLEGFFDYLQLKPLTPCTSISDGEDDLVQISRRASGLYADLRSRFLGDFLNNGRADQRRRLGRNLAKWDQFFLEEQWSEETPDLKLARLSTI
jgi:LPS sulfotransferase NodH